MDSLNTILNSGTYGENVSRHNDNNSKIKQAITTLENVAIANKGYFDTLASLQAAFPSPKAGNIAYVANVASSTGYYIYNVVSGVWTATTTEAPAVGVAISDYAQHGYSSSPKTLKQVDDEVVQLAGDVSQKVSYNDLNVITGDTIFSDFSISDEDGIDILKIQNGDLFTKKFDSSLSATKADIEIAKQEIINDVPAIDDNYTEADLTFVDDDDNKLVEMRDGHIETKNFNSKQVVKTSNIVDSGNDRSEILKIRLNEWSDMQFGMFIHWGVFSAWGGQWSGTDRFGNPGSIQQGGEWMLRNSKMPESEYIAKEIEFTSANWDTDYICKTAKGLGMKYIIITARHHDGFALFESSYAPWNVSTSGADVNILMRLKQSCEKYGLKFGLYLSTFRNWTEVGGYGQEWTQLDGKDPYTNEQHLVYAQKQIEITKELIAKYQPFEFWGDGEGVLIDQMSDLQRLYFPYVFTNNRAGLSSVFGSIEGNVAVFDDVFSYKRERCKFFQVSWGYNWTDETIGNLKQFKEELWNMITSLSRGYNILENVGPKGDGSFPDTVKTWLGWLSNWCKKYFYFNRCKRTLTYSNYPWGRTVWKDNHVYCIVLPQYSSIKLSGINSSDINGVYIYDIINPDDVNNYIIGDEEIQINNITSATTDTDPFHVVRIDFDTDPIFSDYFETDGLLDAKTFIATKDVAETRVRVNWNPSENIIINNTSLEVFSVVTRLKWLGVNGNYNAILDATMNGDQEYKVYVYDEYDDEIGVLNGIGSQSGVISLSSSNYLALANNHVYKIIIEIKCINGSTAVINSMSFNNLI